MNDIDKLLALLDLKQARLEQARQRADQALRNIEGKQMCLSGLQSSLEHSAYASAIGSKHAQKLDQDIAKTRSSLQALNRAWLETEISRSVIKSSRH